MPKLSRYDRIAVICAGIVIGSSGATLYFQQRYETRRLIEREQAQLQPRLILRPLLSAPWSDDAPNFRLPNGERLGGAGLKDLLATPGGVRASAGRQTSARGSDPALGELVACTQPQAWLARNCWYIPRVPGNLSYGWNCVCRHGRLQ